MCSGKNIRGHLTATGAPKARRNRATTPPPLCGLGWSHHTQISRGKPHTLPQPRGLCGLYKRPGCSIFPGSSVKGSLLHTSQEPGPAGQSPPALLRPRGVVGGRCQKVTHPPPPHTPSLASLPLLTSRASPGWPTWAHGWQWRTKALNWHRRGSPPGSDTRRCDSLGESLTVSELLPSAIKGGEYLSGVVVKGDAPGTEWALSNINRSYRKRDKRGHPTHSWTPCDVRAETRSTIPVQGLELREGTAENSGQQA